MAKTGKPKQLANADIYKDLVLRSWSWKINLVGYGSPTIESRGFETRAGAKQSCVHWLNVFNIENDEGILVE